MALPGEVAHTPTLVSWEEYCFMQGHFSVEFFLYVLKELKLAVSAIEDYRSALNHVFILS